MLFNEPKLLKYVLIRNLRPAQRRFSALQRAEIAEILRIRHVHAQRIERFSALQRAEIAEIRMRVDASHRRAYVSVLFNEPKLLKFWIAYVPNRDLVTCFSALQRAEIAEIVERYRFALRLSDVSVLFNEPKLLKCC